jgi:kinesin family protein 4/21/27
MAQKESHHRELVDELNDELAHVRRQLDDLATLSRDQVSQSCRYLLGFY